ncbi:MAG: polymer-forming cytoskeletal protein [Syntrophales bacterium]|nr:polymer-forming cytoskeletal protein [Syntrophales bacterium]
MFNRKSDKLEMVLGENSKIVGDVESLGTILVEGTILGNLNGEKIILGEKASVKGHISANCISIAGKIEGNLLGKDSVEIKGTARILGDIITKSISMMDGAIFNGMCRMDHHLQQGQSAETEKNVVEFSALERQS